MKALIADVNYCAEKELNISQKTPIPIRITINGFEHKFVPFAIADRRRWALGEAYLLNEGVLSETERAELDMLIRKAANTVFTNSQPRLKTKFHPRGLICLHEQGLVVYLNSHELSNSYFDTCELVSDLLVTNYKGVKTYLRCFNSNF